MAWPFREPTERERWATKRAVARTATQVGLPGLDPISARLYGEELPRGVLVPRSYPERPRINHFMRPEDVLRLRYEPGQIIVGKVGGQPIGLLDDRPIITVAGARAGKTRTVLEPNLYLWPGSALVLDPKGELARETAEVRRALGHAVHVLDPFGQSGLASASYNILDELDPAAESIIDDVGAISQAVIPEERDSRSRHWVDSARALLEGTILLTLTLPKSERHFVTVRQLLTLTHALLLAAVRADPPRRRKSKNDEHPDEALALESQAAIETLTRAMAAQVNRFDGILEGLGKRFTKTPVTERGNILSTAAANTDFWDSLPMRRISRRSDFSLGELREGNRPTTIYLVLPAGNLQTHFRWLRLIIQQACTLLEKFGAYPLGRLPILFLMEEFATLGFMPIMQKAAAYFPGFGVKLWAVLQDLSQLEENYGRGAETILGNAGLVQAFANNDETTLRYIKERLGGMMESFELRTALSRAGHGQLLMIEGLPPAVTARLERGDVQSIRAGILARARRP